MLKIDKINRKFLHDQLDELYHVTKAPKARKLMVDLVYSGLYDDATEDEIEMTDTIIDENWEAFMCDQMFGV